MNHPNRIVAGLILLMFVPVSQASGGAFGNRETSHQRLVEFAQCLTERGWVMYSSFTCSACRAQRELFGPAVTHLKIVECSPHAPDTQAQQCLDRRIRYTPTWLKEANGIEVKRIKGYKKLEDLASVTDCPMD